MTEQTEHSTLRRKAGTGRAPSGGTGMNPAKAFRLAVSKAAEVELGLPVRPQAIREEHLTQAQILDALDEEALLLILEGPHDARGVAIFDIQALSAVIEVQTLGKVIASEATKRHPTRIDSAMCEALLDRVLKEFEGHLADTGAADWATGFRFGNPISSLRLLGLALVDIPYRLFHLPLDFADGAKHGLLQIVLPAEGVRCQKPGAGGDGGWALALENAVSDSHAGITGVLHRVQKTVSEVQAMAVGDLIDVPKAAISGVSMEGSDGCVVGGARLGQQNGFRALRVTGAGAILPPMINSTVDLPTTELATTDLPTTDLPSEMGAMDMALPDSMDAMAELDGMAAPMGDLPDLPMMPMEAAPMDGIDDLPMAAMPMDIEIA